MDLAFDESQIDDHIFDSKEVEFFGNINRVEYELKLSELFKVSE
jgi:hypothetical protein